MKTANPAPGIPQLHELGDRLGPAVSLATTEHFTLQTARATTVAEASSRATGYFAVLSSTLIVLAFVGNMSGLSDAFYLFCALLLPVLAFVGIVTFGRLVQSSNEEIAYAQRIARLRSFYVDVAPELEPYLMIVRSGADDHLPSTPSAQPSRRQLLLTIPGMIVVVNGVVIGAACGLLAGVLTSNPMASAVLFGLPAAGVSLIVQFRHHRLVLQRRDGMVVDAFAVVVPPDVVEGKSP
jgi:hypothetical protein